MKIFILIFLSTFVYSDSYPIFSPSELLQVEKKSGKISKNRILDYVKKIEALKKYPRQKQLNSLNIYLNQLQPQYDEVIKKQEDYWATPKEFLSCGYGDCEDYVIIKYYSLINLGLDKNKLFLSIVNQVHSKTQHMILSYFYKKNKSPLILDNLSFKILSLEKRKDLVADIFINETGIYKLNNNILIKVPLRSPQFEDLKRRVAEGN